MFDLEKFREQKTEQAIKILERLVETMKEDKKGSTAFVGFILADITAESMLALDKRFADAPEIQGVEAGVVVAAELIKIAEAINKATKDFNETSEVIH